MKHPALQAVAAALVVLGAGGCGPLIGVEATVRLDERTRLERDVLGERAGLAPAPALLAFADGEARPAGADLPSLLEGYQAAQQRLAEREEHDAESRAWQVICLHNRAVLRAWQGDRAAARELLGEALERGRAYRLATLEWQVLLAMAEMAEEGPGTDLLRQAAVVLADAPVLTELDHGLERRAQRSRLYGRLVAAALDAGEPEQALRHAAEREAVELARVLAPGELRAPAGEAGALLAELSSAREAAAQARERLCALALDEATADAAPAGAFEEASSRLAEAVGRLLASSPVGGLLAPDMADLAAIQEALGQDTVLLAFAPTGKGEYAGFLLGAGTFRAERLRLSNEAAGAVTPPLTASEEVLGNAAVALLGPFARDLAGAGRLYLVPPPELSGLAWQALRVEGQALGERVEVAFLGGLADLPWAFRQRNYGRRSVLVCGGWPGDLQKAKDVVGQQAEASYFDVRERGKADLPDAAAFADLLWFLNPLEVRSAAPAESHLAFPGELGLLDGLTAGEVASLETRATAAGFGAVSADAFRSGSHGGLRVVTRALMAAGVPSAVYGVAPERAPGGGEAYWRAFLAGARTGAASAAHQEALTALEPCHRPAFRLYGFAGMNEQEYRELSALEFNDLARRAGAALSGERFERAAGDYLDLWHMARAVDFESEARRARVLAQVEQQLVRCFHALGRFEPAVRYQRSLVAHLEEFEGGAGPLTAVAYQSLGALLTEAERFREATDAYARSIELLREQGRQADLADVLGELGKSLDRAGEYELALETLRDALEEYRPLQRPEGVARQHQRMGAILLKRLNNAPRAEEHFAAARGLFEQAGASADVVETTVDIGLCRRALGELDGALELFEQALASAEGEGMRAARARALTELANTRWLRGEYQRSFELVRRSNEIAEGLDSPLRLNANYQLLGLIYWELNDYGRALDALERAAEFARRARAPLEVASALNNRGIVLRRRGDYDEALTAFREALAIDTRLKTRWGRAYDERNMGTTLHRMGRLAEAAPHLVTAVELSREIGDRVNLAKSLLALGELRLDEGAREEAAELLRSALEAAREVYLPEVEWRALWGVGRLRRAGGDRAAALEALAAAVDVVEAMREAVKIGEFQSGFLTNKMELYEDVVELLLDMGRAEQAFTYAERSRARRFMDLLAGRDFELKTERERRLYAGLQELGRRMRGLQQTLAQEDDAERRAPLARELEELRTRYADLLVDIRTANPGLSAFVEVEAVGPDELARTLPAEAALLVYYVLPQELVIWALCEGELTAQRVPVERADLTDSVRAYRLMVQNRELLSQVRTASQRLSELLLPAALRRRLEGSGVIGIVPHGPLHYVSFASLHDGEAFLVERRPLFYGPSASALRRLLAEEVPPKGEGLQVLALGNPAVGDPAYELPFTEREVVSIGRSFVEVTPLTGEGATEDRLKEDLARFDVVHIGAHGQFDPVNPLFSALMLARGEEDGMLHLHEVTGLELNARLVTLSACQSGLGELRAADELVSLARAFTYAGTRSIVSTLWRVDDVSTALVTKHFYRHYVAHGAAESLRHAQLQVMNDGRHYHPTYWAGVVLTGDYR
jgi:CHAT domain-containing protein